MRFRHERISENHAQTFDWIFESESDTEDQTQQHPKVHYLEWLRSSESAQSTYWLGGKAGSGKSTLMKYLCSHERVQTELQAWSGDEEEPPVIASFFFWRSGTELQKSQEGLLRSLLFEVLRRCPSIISKVIEMKWTYAVRDPWSRPKEQEPWTQSEMMQVFNLIGDEHVNSKFCFFIDGLDEYNGDPCDLIEVIQKLARSPNFKFCVSSRPWTDFTRVFDIKGRALHLHELTQNDIRIYIRDKLEQHDRFIQEGPRDSSYQDLVTEIVERAQGVFLWVSLVVKSLLTGLTHADSIEILQQRLRLLPTDLEDLFSHMIRSVDPIYESQMGRTFLVAMTASEPLPLILYHTLDELQTIPSVALQAEVHTRQEWKAHSDKLLQEAKRLISAKECDMRVRLEVRSRGLLEVPTNSSHSDNAASLRVEFLHRTVRDYLKRPEITEDLVRRASKAEQSCGTFVPEVALCHCLLAGIKLLPPGEPGDHSADEVLELVDDLLWYAYGAEISTKAAQKDVLDELNKTLSIMFPPKSSLGLIKNRRDSFQPLHPEFLRKYNSTSMIELYVHRGLSKYFGLKVSPELVARRFKQPLLADALFPMKSPKHGPVNTYEMVPLLLENGADPNVAVRSNCSLWSAFLDSCFESNTSSTNLRRRIPPVEVVDPMLRAGADANVRSGTSSAFGRIVTGDFDDDLWGQRLHLIQSFIRHGASPNFKFDREDTIWEERLSSLYKARNESSSSRHFEEVKLLLQAKANVKVLVLERESVSSVGEIRVRLVKVEEAIRAIFNPYEAAELLQITDGKVKDRGMLARVKRSLHGIVRRTT